MARYSGFVDTVNSDLVAGWLYDADSPKKRIDVVAVQGEQVLGKATCTEFRPDLLKLGIADGKYGFRLELAASLLNIKAPISLYFYDEGKILAFPGEPAFEILASDERGLEESNSPSLWFKIIAAKLEDYEGCRDLIKEILPGGGSKRFWKVFRQNLLLASEEQRRELFISLAKNNGASEHNFLTSVDRIRSWMSGSEVRYFSKGGAPVIDSLDQADTATIVSELYMMVLGRMPDENGLKDYRSAIESGLSLEEAWDHLSNSDEFFSMDRDHYVDIDSRIVIGADAPFETFDSLPFDSYYNECPGESASLKVNRVSCMKSASEKQYVVAYLSQSNEFFLGEGVVVEGMFNQENTSIMRSDPGFLLYGMKLDLAPGTYVLDLEIEAADWSAYAVDVVSDFGFHKLYHSDLSGSASFRTTFQVDANNTFIEPRLITLNNNASLRVVRLLVYKK
ncbi:DUF4214 domain-containing protein [Pseudomonas oryzihabitans]|uniref:DUF4214 domain-containing protein n=1 Tax=Pseudomonas oryzihabitans TaxID=47885 RepID=UPI002B1D42C9|nr:DUF4214 domain-containing protein [Pseudomonas oryzihabitans]